ncbi:hypothetical protein BR93DRAFT_699581 [Coniochaeta sp. PMI_546]|nr:hypothetical protein BR93DRAFT_699581 [Coniochaeta sp. PMI_546]
MYQWSEFDAGRYVKQRNALAPSRSRPPPPRIAPHSPQQDLASYRAGAHEDVEPDTTRHSFLSKHSVLKPTSSASPSASPDIMASHDSATGGLLTSTSTCSLSTSSVKEARNHSPRQASTDRPCLFTSSAPERIHQSLPTHGTVASRITLPPSQIDAISRSAGLSSSAAVTDCVRGAKKQALLKLQDLASDMAMYEKEKKKISKENRAPQSFKRPADMTMEGNSSVSSRPLAPVSPPTCKHVLESPSAMSSKRPFTRSIARDIVNDSEEGSEDDSAGLNESTQSFESPPMIADPQPLEHAPSGRSYRAWDDSGQLKHTCGALLPDGYQKSSNQEFPWICPVRSCRVLFSSLAGIGSHFSRIHRARCLNDNLDGTFTEISKYGEKRAEGSTKMSRDEGKPPIVVSTGHLFLDESPIARPKLQLKYQDAVGTKRPRSAVDSPAPTDKASRADISQRPATRRRTSEPQNYAAPSPRSLEPITTTAAGRSYTTWFNDVGALVSTAGALLPDGYKLDDALPERPWIRPVRSCRRLFATLPTLGQHFRRGHKGCHLNDNLDGTLSLLATFEDTAHLVDQGTSPLKDVLPVIMSRHALPLDESPLLLPQMPYFPPGQDPKNGIAKWISVPVRMQSTKPPFAQCKKTTSVRTRGFIRSTTSPDVLGSVWEYIRQFLDHTTPFHDDDILRELLLLPRARDLHWKPASKHGIAIRNDRDLLSLVIQVTGEEAETPCSGCRGGLGPYAGCIVISSAARAETVHSRWQCANCVYEGCRVVTCSIKDWSRSRMGAVPSAVGSHSCTPRPKPKLDTNKQRGNPASKRVVTPRKLGASNGRILRSSTRAPQGSALSGTGPRRGGPRRASISIRREKPACDGDVFLDNRVGSKAMKTADDTRAPPPDQFFSGQISQPAILTMEEWEMAPGRIHKMGPEGSDNIALSRAYLSSTQAARVTDTLSVRVRTLTPGAAMHLHLEPDADKTRLCILIAGQVHVKMDGDVDFIIGPGGLFVVKPGVAARVQNRLFMDCALHVVVCDE